MLLPFAYLMIVIIKLSPACFCTCNHADLAIVAHSHRLPKEEANYAAKRSLHRPRQHGCRSWPTPAGEQACTYNNDIAKRNELDKGAGDGSCPLRRHYLCCRKLLSLCAKVMKKSAADAARREDENAVEYGPLGHPSKSHTIPFPNQPF